MKNSNAYYFNESVLIFIFSHKLLSNQNIVDLAFDNLPDKENTLIHCDNYGEAGAINFYSKQKFTQAVSMNADYINWYPLDKMEIKNVILVKEDTD